MALTNISRLVSMLSIGLLSAQATVALADTGLPAEPGAPAPSSRFDSLLNGYSFELDVSEDEAKASAQVGGFSALNFDEAGVSSQKSMTWKVGLDVPFGGQSNFLDGATLDALGDGIKLSGAINFLSFSSSAQNLVSEPFLLLHDSAVDRCLQKNQADAAATEVCNLAKDRPTKKFAADHLPGQEAAINDALFSGFHSYGFRASLGANRFKFVTPGTLAEQDTTKLSVSAAANYAYYPGDAVSVWKAEIEFASAIEAADDTIVCKTVVVDPADDCVKAAAIGPSRKESLVLRGEYRRFFPLKNGKSGIGAALTGSVDTLSGEYGVELPIYIHIGGDSPISPGFKVGYSSKEDFSYGFFLKSTFSF